MRELTAAIGERLGFYGPTISLSPEEGISRLGAEASEFALGSNSRVRAIVARTLGWDPQHNDLIEGIRSGKYAVWGTGNLTARVKMGWHLSKDTQRVHRFAPAYP